MRKKNSVYCKISLIAVLVFCGFNAQAQKDKREFYEIRVYHFKDSVQEKQLDSYFMNAFIPAMHRMKIIRIGVLKPIDNDTLTDKLVYVLYPLSSLDQLTEIPKKLESDKEYQQAATDFINAPYKQPTYSRMESIILHALPLAPKMQVPELKSVQADRVYELRSYESATEKIFRNKVQMFNEGGEITLFKRLGFNAVFYAEVISGAHMPNLMYMTSFENKSERDAHWKTFGADPEWKRLSSLPEYQNNVSHIDILFLRGAGYSEF